MIIFWIIIGIVAVYFFLVFFVLRLVAPFMGFGQYRLPNDLPLEVKAAITDLENKSADPKTYLQNAFNLVLSRWYAVRYKAVTEFFKIFRKNLSRIWQEQGYAHCTTQNFVLYTLLANSKYFKPEDIKVCNVFLNFVPHQYLKVKINEEWIDADPAAASALEIPLGKHGEGIG